MNSTGRPIGPDDADELVAAKQATIPEAVFEAFNELIARDWDGTRAIITQQEVVDLITSKMAISRADVYRRKYLDIEVLYKAVGWHVEYDKPAFNESSPATFIFTRP